MQDASLQQQEMEMYLIIKLLEEKGEADFFGPFPTEERAKEYAESFEVTTRYSIHPIIVPNCVQVKLMY